MKSKRRRLARAATYGPSTETELMAMTRLHTLLVRGASLAGPTRLSGRTLDVLLHAERRGLHTVLVAGKEADLHTPVAAVCRFVFASEASIALQAQAMWGKEQVRLTDSLDDRSLLRHAKALPVPESRTLLRRLQVHLRDLRARWPTPLDRRRR